MVNPKVPTLRLWVLCGALLLLTGGRYPLHAADLSAPAALWPQYRQRHSLAGRFPLRGGLAEVTIRPRLGRWITVRYIRPLGSPYVVAYEGRSGEELWKRVHFGF